MEQIEKDFLVAGMAIGLAGLCLAAVGLEDMIDGIFGAGVALIIAGIFLGTAGK